VLHGNAAAQLFDPLDILRRNSLGMVDQPV
jgi:hypothetical protein